MSKTDSNHNHKIITGLVALLFSGLVIVGVGYAFFSDVITGTGTATAGTLDITGTVTLNQNGDPITDPNSDIANFNPGDLISIDASTITNAGNKSAWIRAVLHFTQLSNQPNTASGVEATGDLSNYLWICSGSESQSDLIVASFTGADTPTDSSDDGFANSTYVSGGQCQPVSVADVTNETMFGQKTSYAAPGDVISGSAEADGADTTWTPTALPTIYFDAAATNSAQLGTASFSVLVQALQYRNNTTSPTEAQWSTVVDVPFTL